MVFVGAALLPAAATVALECPDTPPLTPATPVAIVIGWVVLTPGLEFMSGLGD
jgi:hypothetical protein